MNILEKYGEWINQGTSQSIKKAYDIAKKAHQGQTRNIKTKEGEDIEYITHPLKVAELVKQLKSSHKISDLIKAAILHDTVQDTDITLDYIKNEFGELVHNLVKELTNDPEEMKRIGKTQYLTNKMLHMTSWALIIKLADRYSNVEDLFNAFHGSYKQKVWANKYAIQTQEIIKELKEKRELTSTQKNLVELIENKLNDFFKGMSEEKIV
jgi:GTP pyrophosphokinase